MSFEVSQATLVLPKKRPEVSVTIDMERFRMKPFQHQMVGIKALLTHPFFALFDEMGVGKSYQVINSACVLYDNDIIDTVVIACPAQVKTVWMNTELGEIPKHTWVPSWIIHYYGKHTTIDFRDEMLNWIIVSYEFLRQEEPLADLAKQIKKRRSLLVMDESIFLKNPKAKQTKQTFILSGQVSRKVILNGTPTGGNLMDLYCQFKMLNPFLLQCRTWYQFRNRYAIMGGFQNKQIVGFRHAEEVQRLTAPYVLRRLKEDCLDLPPKTFSHLECALTDKTWQHYKSMRDNMITWLTSAACQVQHAPVKALRLAQIVSGFLGGVIDAEEEEFQLTGIPGIIPISQEGKETRTEEISQEKLDLITDWLHTRFDENENFRVLIWARFRPELDRLERYLRADSAFRRAHIVSIRGGQSKSARSEAVNEGMAGSGPAIGLGQPHAGGFGLNLTTFPYVVYLSRDHSLLARLQSEDRVHRPGQIHNVEYFDVMATGPSGQKTVDHAIVRALRKKEEISKWTTEQWRAALSEA